MIFFTSDLHFFHRNVIRLCNRPFKDLDEMHRELIGRWNEVVSPDDTVYVLGDVFFCGTQKAEAILNQLNGRLILVRGNHDHFSLTKLRTMFAEVHSQLELEIAGQNVLLSHYPFAPTEREILTYKLKNLWKFWRKKKYMDLRYMDRRPENKGGFLLHGHVHTAWRQRGRMINVGVDQWNFTPVSLETIESLIRKS